MPAALGQRQESRAFASAHVSGDNWRTVTQQAIKQLGHGHKGGLGLVYMTDELAEHAASIVMLLRSGTGVDDWVGASGLGVCSNGYESFGEPALAVMVLDLDATDYRLIPSLSADEMAGCSADIQGWLGEKNPFLGLVHAPPAADVQDSLQTLKRVTGAHIVGGLASGYEQPMAVSEMPSDRGVSGVLFAAQQPVVTGLTQGCSPVGTCHRVTQSQGNVVVELDGRPAFEVFSDDMRLLAEQVGLARPKGDVHIGLLTGGARDGSRGDYLVRNLMGIDPEKGLIGVAEQIETGQDLMFVWRSAETVKQDMNRMLADVKQRLGGAKPRGAIYISCLARGPNTFKRANTEMGLVRAALGDDVPVTGFFANGEISDARLYSYTGVLTLFL